MKRMTYFWVACVALAAFSLVAGNSRASLDDETNAAVNAVADLIAKGDTAAAKKAAKAISDKIDVETFMSTLKLRSKGGIGIGTKGLIADVKKDGIEKKIEEVAQFGITADNLKKEGAALVRAGHVTAAVAMIAHGAAPEKDLGKKKRSDWLEWSQGVVKSAEEFSAAAKSNNVGDLKKASRKLQQNCDSCHSIFK